MRKVGAVVFAAVLLSGCAGLGTASCPVGSASMLEADLYFGRDIPSGGFVSDEDWQHFVDTEVTPRFPDGFTVEDASGQWKGLSGIVREKSKRLLIIVPKGGAAEKLAAIRKAYQTRFKQEATGLVEYPVCGSF